MHTCVFGSLHNVFLPAGSELLKIVLVILVGMPASLLVTAAVAKNIRKVVNTKMEPPDVTPPSAPFTKTHHIAWSEHFVKTIFCSTFVLIRRISPGVLVDVVGKTTQQAIITGIRVRML